MNHRSRGGPGSLSSRQDSQIWRKNSPSLPCKHFSPEGNRHSNICSLRHDPAINAIPVELLSSILHFVRGDSEEEPDPKRAYAQNLFLVRLSSVCHHWRRTAIGDGSLWQNIAFSPSLASTVKCATKFLERSRGASLTVSIWNEDTTDAVVESPAVEDLLVRLAHDASRIATFVATNPPDVVLRALKHPARNLGYLSVQMADSREIPSLFCGTMPNLEVLCISNPSGWKIAQFQHLHTVHISASSWRPWRLSMLLDCLDGTAVLGELHLACFEDFEPEPAAETERTVVISGLLVLRLTYCNAAFILNHLEIPRSTALSIYNYCRDSEHILVGFPKSPRLFGTLERIHLLTVVFDVGKQVFEVEIMGPEGVHILLGAVPRLGKFERKWVLRSMAAVTRSTSTSGVKWLTMVIDEYRMPWKVWLSKFTRLSTLEVRCPDPEHLLDVLVTSYSSTGEVICPLLRSLSLERSRRPALDSSLLRGFLTTRASTGNAISQLNLNEPDWSMVAGSEFEAWEELINRTQLDGKFVPRGSLVFFFYFCVTVTVGSFTRRDGLLISL